MSECTPGPSRFELLRNSRRIRANVAGYLLEVSRRYGDTVRLPLLSPTYLLNNPPDIEHVLVTHEERYHKTGGLTVGRSIFGQGLVSSDGELHRRQRKILQPAFHPQVVARSAERMTDVASRMLDRWNAGDTVDISREMMRMTFAIVGRALFSSDLAPEADILNAAYTTIQRHITHQQRHIPIPESIPTPRNLRFRAALRRFDDSVSRIIASHRAATDRPDDVLTMLLEARTDDGTPLSDRQIRDEVVTLLVAGHETVSNALAWTWYLLSLHPDIEAKFNAELDSMLRGRLPTTDDTRTLQYTGCVFMESLRLYPPAWILARRAVQDDTLPGGLTIRAGEEVIMAQYVANRNEQYFPEPERFSPERFGPSPGPQRPRYAFFPFGGGSRYCIGESFARLEALLLLATIGQRYTLELIPGQRIELEPMITLRPKNGIRMIVRPRTTAGQA